ncbi:hypothetical protein [Pseudomonas putida]|uniref:Uncharacterized protein n=1 Tax=Pseudomonas putida TaxID=303 RepID=A0A8I1ECK9_PSEPU|nr:hypothetical protein [Pseudomonas putida]MBI6882814.1 hypothetical protein [Pseudomonas putida]
MSFSSPAKWLAGAAALFVIGFGINSMARPPVNPVGYSDNSNFKYVHVADLPVWNGNPETLSWINPIRLENKTVGILPDIKWGANKRNMIVYSNDLMEVDKQPFKFSYDWSFETSAVGCLQNTIAMRNRAMGGKDFFTVNQYKNAGALTRYLSCLNHPAAVYYAVETPRYVALMTSEPGWLFYDKDTYTFKPIVVETNRDEASNLYISSTGQFLIDIQRTPDDDQSLGKGEKKADGIRMIF